MKYRKKPIVIEAWTATELWLAAKEDWKLLPDAVRRVADKWIFLGDRSISIPTLEGEMLARSGDMVIMGVNGEFYPCKADIFAKTYESF